MLRDVKKPAFNFGWYTENSLPHNGQQLMLMYMEDIHTRDEMLLYSQMCDAGYRMGRENEDYNKWNQCVYEDIDYKFYIADHENSYVDPTKIYEDINEYLYKYYKNFIYYSEFSRHMNGFHFIFYFSTERTKENRLKCKAIVNYIIKESFIECGYKDIIEWPGVFDGCTDSFYQACFLTKINFKLNEECSGEGWEEIIEDHYYSINNILERLEKKTRNYKEIKRNKDEKNDKWDLEYILKDKNYDGGYLNHHERYRLFRSIVGLCGGIDNIYDNLDIIKEEWENCAKQLPEGNGHNFNFYLKEPYRNNWIRWIMKNETYCYVDDELIKQFGYDVKYNINKENNENIVKQKRTKKIRSEKVYIA